MTTGALAGDVVVVSPHLDDAVMSLAATIARAVKAGARVRVLTVFGCDPASTAPADGWDRRGGYATEGEAAAGRRNEDRAACAIVGAEPVWMTFPDGGYARGSERPPGPIVEAVAEAVSGADTVLVPGFPLTNPDHAWLAQLLLEQPLPCGRVGLYAEQPYRYMVRHGLRRLEAPPQLRGRLAGATGWTHTARGLSDLRLKQRAIRAYATQLPLLGFTAHRGRRLRRLLLDEALHGGEAIALVPA